MQKVEEAEAGRVSAYAKVQTWERAAAFWGLAQNGRVGWVKARDKAEVAFIQGPSLDGP